MCIFIFILCCSAARSGDSPIHYDDTVDSAMHIYEKLRRSRSGSLPSRRVKKTRKPPPSSTTTNNLSALNLSRAEELRTAQDLEEIKRALLALQQNSLGLLANIQCENNTRRTRPEPPAQRKSRGVYSVSQEQLARSAGKFSLPTGGSRKTISTTNLIGSGKHHLSSSSSCTFSLISLLQGPSLTTLTELSARCRPAVEPAPASPPGSRPGTRSPPSTPSTPTSSRPPTR